ncbi:secreted lipase [Hyphodiscus hymeniophilus]|uniref:Secreted lipase n=1 Tax=Hyphodiscus hymeniophilus TaxID=353542 RepID=A0A9P6VRY5_9HELO|nr:secreted lipase [Hyphodiscus hymeniophilus]
MRTTTRSLLVGAVAAACVTEAALLPRSTGPIVELGYATYQGSFDDTFGLNVWKSIRYAQPPIGNLRWQAPQKPLAINSNEITPAINQPPLCPQTGAFGTPAVYGFNSGLGNEDCLYLNVYAAPDAANLPVFLWIHGGGYSDFGAEYDPSVLMNTNGNGFIHVEIQYRLGAFGYLSSPDIKKQGQLNAGLLDQRFALQWVQEHISKFGGDPTRVTMGGESSGAGSIIAASPYLPAIYNYNDPVPTGNYDDFAQHAGCGKGSSTLSHYPSTFDCLVAADTVLLQNASGIVSTTRGFFGSFGFLPVLDGDLIQTRPSEQLLLGQVSGHRLLVGNNANEGVPLSDPTIRTRAEFDAYVSTAFPNFNQVDKALLDAIYLVAESQPGDDGVRFDTLGNTGPTALTESGLATGIQQTVFDIFAESTFDCPGYWMAEAFSLGSRQAWKYQYSVEPNYHGADLSAYWAVNATIPNADFRHAFQKIWGNFIIHNNPSISLTDASANFANATVPTAGPGAKTILWPNYSILQPQQLDLNTTGGIVELVTVTDDLSYNERTGSGIVNKFRLIDAFTWERGRGARCDFWRAVSPNVPY